MSDHKQPAPKSFRLYEINQKACDKKMKELGEDNFSWFMNCLVADNTGTPRAAIEHYRRTKS